MTVSSPNGKLTLTFELINGTPNYSLLREDQVVICPSKMGFRFKNRPEMTNNFKVVGIEQNSKNETWEQPWGEFRYEIGRAHV